MVVDICYHDYGPEQRQNVRRIILYTQHDANANPEVVLHYDTIPDKYIGGQENIKLSSIRTLTISRD